MIAKLENILAGRLEFKPNGPVPSEEYIAGRKAELEASTIRCADLKKAAGEA